MGITQGPRQSGVSCLEERRRATRSKSRTSLSLSLSLGRDLRKTRSLSVGPLWIRRNSAKPPTRSCCCDFSPRTYTKNEFCDKKNRTFSRFVISYSKNLLSRRFADSASPSWSASSGTRHKPRSNTCWPSRYLRLSFRHPLRRTRMENVRVQEN